MNHGEKVQSFINRYGHLVFLFQCIEVEIVNSELATAVLNGLPERCSYILIALHALADEDVSLDFVKSRFLDEEKGSTICDSG